jgi:hypothetical protein
MHVITEEKQTDLWLARVRLETETGWRCFQAAGDSRLGALMELHYAMWRYQGAPFEAARRAVVTAASRSPHAARSRRGAAMRFCRRQLSGVAARQRHSHRRHRRAAWA